MDALRKGNETLDKFIRVADEYMQQLEDNLDSHDWKLNKDFQSLVDQITIMDLMCYTPIRFSIKEELNRTGYYSNLDPTMAEMLVLGLCGIYHKEKDRLVKESYLLLTTMFYMLFTLKLFWDGGENPMSSRLLLLIAALSEPEDIQAPCNSALLD